FAAANDVLPAVIRPDFHSSDKLSTQDDNHSIRRFAFVNHGLSYGANAGTHLERYPLQSVFRQILENVNVLQCPNQFILVGTYAFSVGSGAAHVTSSLNIGELTARRSTLLLRLMPRA